MIIFRRVECELSWLGFCPHQNWCVWFFAVTFRNGGIKWLQWVSKRWHSSFEVDHHQISSRWMRPQLPRFLSARVGKRWHSSFQVDHHHLSSHWMRPQLARFFFAPKLMMCLVLFGCFPEWAIQVTSVSQQKMTLFFSSRWLSSFVALNTTLGCSVFVHIGAYAYLEWNLNQSL